MDDKVAEQLKTLSPQEKRAMLAQIRSNKIRKPKTAPMSFAQNRIWMLDQINPGGSAFNISAAYHLTGVLDTAVLEKSLNKIIQRHDILRTTFAVENNKPVQVIAPHLTIYLPVKELQYAADREAKIRQLVIEEEQKPFDLARGPLLRAMLFQLALEEYVLIFTTHRMAFDGQCWQVLIAELMAFCESLSNNRMPLLPELPLQYAEFAAWQHAWLAGEEMKNQLAYWQQKLTGQIRLLQLPTDFPRHAAKSPSELHSFTLSADLSQALRVLSQKESVSLFVTLLAALYILLYRHTSQQDFLVFSSVSGRSRPQLERLIGLFANILALRADISDDLSFRELLSLVQETVADAYAHQNVPFEEILDRLQIERQRYTPLFQVMFIFWPNPLPTLEWPGLTLRQLDIDTKPAEFDLHFLITNTQPEMTGMLRYKSDLFERDTIERWLKHYQTILADIVLAPEKHISDLIVPQVKTEQTVAGIVPILPSQWQYLKTPHLWINMVEAVELHGAVDPAHLEKAVKHLMEHHDALRTRFIYEEDTWRQVIPATVERIPFSCIDFSDLPVAEHQDALKNELVVIQSSLGPLAEDLIRVVLLNRGQTQPGYLILVVNHVVADNASVSILLEDLYHIYQMFAQGDTLQLPPKTTSIKTWAEQMEVYLQSQKFRKQLEGELALFKETIAPLPVDYLTGKSENKMGSIASVRVSLSVEETNILHRHFSRLYKTWMIDILLAALVAAVTRWSEQDYMSLKIIDSGRNLKPFSGEEIDLSRTVGCLFVPGLLTLKKPDTNDPVEMLQAIKKQLLQMPTYGISIGIAQTTTHLLMEHISPVELRFNYLGQVSLPSLPGWTPQTSTAMDSLVANRRHGDFDRNPILLNCTAVIVQEQLLVNWEYSKNVHKCATIERVAAYFMEALQAMVQHYQANEDIFAAQTQVYVAPRTPLEEQIAAIWAKALGLERVGIHDNFFELGGDSLLATRIFSYVCGDFQIDLPFHLLFETPTVAGMAVRSEIARKLTQDWQTIDAMDQEGREEGIL